MKKWIIILVVVIAAGAVAWKYKGPGTVSSASSPLLDFVPADTLYYVGGQNPEDVLKIMENHTIFSSMSSGDSSFDKVLSAFSEEDSPALKFFTYFVKAYKESAISTYKDFYDFLGAKGTEPFAVYNQGFAPVVRMKLEDTSKIEKLIEDAVAESGWQYQEATLDNAKIRYWPIKSENLKDGAEEIAFAVAFVDGIFTMTIFVPSEDENTRRVRFGLAKPEQSLAKGDELKVIQKKYGFSNELLGFFNIERATASALANEEEALGKAFMGYFSKGFKDEMLDKEVTEACRADYTRLASSVPRVVFGYTDLAVKGNELKMSFDIALEVNNEAVNTQLQKLGGHIPLHTLGSREQIIGFGLGMDVAGAIPALTSLWNDFISQEFSCESLIKAQEQVKQANPAMLAIATGMAQGVKGFGVSLYDLTIDGVTSLPSKASALISLGAEDPQTVLSLSSLVPQLAGINIPSDGTVVDLNLPMLPPGVVVKAGVKGKHIVIYTGDLPAKTLDKVAAETLDVNGLYAVSLNYERVGKAAMDNLSLFSGPEACFNMFEVASMLKNAPMDMSFTLGFDDKGAALVSTGHMRAKDPLADINIAGKYSLQFLDNNCQWLPAGNEVIKEDGTGSYEEQDSAKECVLFSTAYSWTKNKNKLTMDVSTESARDTCADELEESKAENYHCYIMNAHDKGFDCFFDPGTENASIYRYTKQ